MGLLGKSKQPKREPNKAEMLRDAAETLLDAAKRGDLATLKRLVEEGVDLEARGEYYESALMKAAEAGNLDCLEHLVTKGANVNATNDRFGTALMKAAANGNLGCLEHLVTKGAELEAENIDGSTALMWAAFQGELDCLELLIAKGAKLESTADGHKKAGKWTALHIAALHGHAPCVEALLKAGADARLKDKRGITALDLAKETKRTEVIALLESAAAIAAQVSRDAPPLPGGYTLGDNVFYTGAGYTFANGDKVVHGQQGEVAGPATRELTGKGVELRFPGNNGDIGCPLTWVSRAAPPQAYKAWYDVYVGGIIALYHSSV